MGVFPSKSDKSRLKFQGHSRMNKQGFINAGCFVAFQGRRKEHHPSLEVFKGNQRGKATPFVGGAFWRATAANRRSVLAHCRHWDRRGVEKLPDSRERNNVVTIRFCHEWIVDPFPHAMLREVGVLTIRSCHEWIVDSNRPYRKLRGKFDSGMQSPIFFPGTWASCDEQKSNVPGGGPSLGVNQN